MGLFSLEAVKLALILMRALFLQVEMRLYTVVHNYNYIGVHTSTNK